MRSRRVRCLSALAFVASLAAGCSTLIGADGIRIVDDLDPDADDSGRDAQTDTPPPDVGSASPDADAAVPFDAPPPNPACLLKDVFRLEYSVTTDPFPAHATQSFQVLAHDTGGFTNVQIRICPPGDGGAIDQSDPTTEPPKHTWRFAPIRLPAGESQVAFRADPDAQVFGTARILVLP